jgi:hypothetical protein
MTSKEWKVKWKLMGSPTHLPVDMFLTLPVDVIRGRAGQEKVRKADWQKLSGGVFKALQPKERKLFSCEGHLHLLLYVWDQSLRLFYTHPDSRGLHHGATGSYEHVLQKARDLLENYEEYL